MQHNRLVFAVKHVRQWFDGIVPHLSEPLSVEEIKTRLTWLSEGSLLYHLSQFQKPEGFVGGTVGGCPREVWERRVYREFRDYISHLHSKQPVPGVWYSLFHDDMEWPSDVPLKVRGHWVTPDPHREDWTRFSPRIGDWIGHRGDAAQWRMGTLEELEKLKNESS